jgi:hypothetical protein
MVCSAEDRLESKGLIPAHALAPDLGSSGVGTALGSRYSVVSAARFVDSGVCAESVGYVRFCHRLVRVAAYWVWLSRGSAAPRSSPPTSRFSLDGRRTSVLEVSRPSRGPTTGHGASTEAADDCDGTRRERINDIVTVSVREPERISAVPAHSTKSSIVRPILSIGSVVLPQVSVAAKRLSSAGPLVTFSFGQISPVRKS